MNAIKTAEDRTNSPVSQRMVTMGFLTGVMGTGLILMIDFPTSVPVGVMLVLYGIGIWRAMAWPFYGFLAIALVYHFANGSPSQGWVNDLKRLDFVFVIFAIGFLACSFRFLEMSRFSRAFPNMSNSDDYEIDNCETDRRGAVAWGLLGGRWSLIAVSILAATIFLAVFDHDPEMSRQLWIKPPATRLILIVVVLCVAWFVCRGLISVSFRWKMGSDQGGVYFRSIFAKEFWHIHSAIERRRAKIRIQAARRQDVDGDR